MSNTVKTPSTTKAQSIDRAILRELALCFARAAVDEILQSVHDIPPSGVDRVA